MKQSFQRMGEIGILVYDLDQAIETFKSYGIIGPWREFLTDTENVTDVIIDGKPASDLGCRIAMCDYGQMTLELLEPIAPDTDMARTLKERGPVVHHIMFRTNPEFYDVVKEKGIKEVMSAHFPRIGETGRWFDTVKDLGFDIYAWDPNPEHKDLVYPDDYISKGAYNTDK